MGRRSHSRALSIWTNGVRVGRWTIPARGEMQFQYDDGWVKADVGRPLSLSLPFTPDNLPLKGEKVYILARTPAAIGAVQAELPPGFSARVADTVLGGLTQAAAALETARQCLTA